MIVDFCSCDVVVGGYGVLFVFVFYVMVFGVLGEMWVVCNFGGISNIMILFGVGGDVCGFDCGFVNVLIDVWVICYLGKLYDDGGKFVVCGIVYVVLFVVLFDELYFIVLLLKSIGCDLFNFVWFDVKFVVFL